MSLTVSRKSEREVYAIEAHHVRTNKQSLKLEPAYTMFSLGSLVMQKNKSY